MEELNQPLLNAVQKMFDSLKGEIQQNAIETNLAFRNMQDELEQVKKSRSKPNSGNTTPDTQNRFTTPVNSGGGGIASLGSGNLQMIAPTTYQDSKLRKQSSQAEFAEDAAAEKAFIEAKEQEAARTARRQSIVATMAASRVEDTGVQNFRTLQLPPYDHIKLDSLSLKACIKFFKNARLFQTTHSYSLKIQPITSQGVRAQLDRMLLKNGNVVNRRIVSSVLQLTLEDVFFLVQQILIPDNPVEFVTVLQDAIFLRGVEREKYEVVIDETFSDFYTSIIDYRDDFKIGVELLGWWDSTSGKKKPLINNKENGLVRCFLSKLPKQFGSLILALINETEFSSLEEFLSGFFEQVNKLYEQSQGVTKINKALKSRFSKSGSGAASLGDKSSASGGRTWPRASATSNKSSVSSLTAKREPLYEGDRSSEDSDNNSVEAYKTVHYQDFTGSSSSGSDTDSNKGRRQPVHQISSQKKFSGKANNGSEGPRGCIRYIFGRCEAGAGCKFSHEESVLCETAAFQVDAFMKTKYYQMARAKGIAKASVAAVRWVEDVEELGFTDAEVLRNTFLHSLPDACLQRAVYKSGDIKLSSGSSLVVPKILIDSGAVQANYLSKRFVDKHRDVLGGCIKHRPMRAYLADHKTKVDISEVAELKICFEHGGLKYEIVEIFLIFDMAEGGNDAIIGLPTIVRKLLDLFVSMLYEANKLCSELEDGAVNNLLVDFSSAEDNSVPVEPWSQPKDQIAQEDLDTPLPGCFIDALNHMEKGVAEAEIEYKASFAKHVAAEFAQTTDVI